MFSGVFSIHNLKMMPTYHVKKLENGILHLSSCTIAIQEKKNS